MKTIFEACVPREEVLKGELREDIFAARLKDVIEGTADPIYQDPALFFENTYPTEGLKTLLAEAMGRISGVKPTNTPIIRLETAFGGGKTHNLIALYHLAQASVEPSLVNNMLPAEMVPSNKIKCVGVVGSDLSPSDGLIHDDVITYTLWGEIAYALGGKEGYQKIEKSDLDRVAPGTSSLDELVGDEPTLILLDEIARYLRAAKAMPVGGGKSDLAEQTVAFILSLLEFAASKEKVTVVMTLADSSDAFGSETEKLRQELDELKEAKHISARMERVITPTAEGEISAIVTHRLFKGIDRDAAKEISSHYSVYFRKILDQGASISDNTSSAEYAKDIVSNYPFHPELLTTFNRKTSTIPNFQKTRGALRLLALVVRNLWEKKPPNTMLIHPFHIDLSIDDITNDLTSRLERPAFKQVVEADIVSPSKGSPAHAENIDAEWLEAGKPPYASRVATSIFLHSLTQGTATGVKLEELNAAVLEPGDDPELIMRALERLEGTCWFFDYDGHRYRFKTEPSLKKLVDDEMDMVGIIKAKAELDERIKKLWKTGVFKPIPFPSEAADVDDDAKEPKLVIIHYDAAAIDTSNTTPPDIVLKLYDHAGVAEGYRQYKNNVFFLCADRDQVDHMVYICRRYLAISRILSDSDRLTEFNKEQKDKLKGMLEAAELDVRIAITRAYRYLFYPSQDAPRSSSNLARETLPAQEQGEVATDQTKVVLNVLKQLDKVLTDESKPLAATYLRSKAWPGSQQEMTTEELRRAFAQKISLRILLDQQKLKSTIKEGITNDIWVYYDTREQMGYGKVSPPPFVTISEDTILYTPEEAKRRGIQIKGEKMPRGDEVCPVCGEYPCICEVPPPPVPEAFRAEGTPAQAIQSIRDQAEDAGKLLIASITFVAEGEDKEGARVSEAIGLAIPQLGKPEIWLERSMNSEFGPGEKFTMAYQGPWQRYQKIRQQADVLVKEAAKATIKTKVKVSYEGGLDVRSRDLEDLRDILESLSIGKIAVSAEPVKEGDET